MRKTHATKRLLTAAEESELAHVLADTDRIAGEIERLEKQQEIEQLRSAAKPKKKPPGVAIHVWLPNSDLVEVDKAAAEMPVSRSAMVAIIVREWVKKNARVK